VTASPLARRIAGDAGLDIRNIQGSGPGGRIVKRDIEAAMKGGTPAPAAAPTASFRPAAAFNGEAFRDEPLTQIRKTIAKRLGESIGPIPTFYLTAEFDLSRASELRSAAADLGDAFKVSFNDIILKAVATALTQHPEVNAHWLGDKIRYFNTVHLGMAVATDDGLIVPVIFDAQTKGMAQISAEAKVLAKRPASGSSSPRSSRARRSR
jgi:pyruvate dehydrogenase E2 component (dihydrolipoamide acetyltransferase)